MTLALTRSPGVTVPRWLPTIAGMAVVLALWIIGGRAGWAEGMIVTPIEAIRPIVGSTRDLYWRATRATLWSATRGLLIGGVLAFVAALLTAMVPPLRRAINRLAALANAAPWVAVAPCLLVVLGRDNGPTAVAALAVFFFVFVGATVGLSAAPRSAHDVLTALGAPRRSACGRCNCPAVGRRSSTDSSSPPPRRWPAPSSASGTAPSVGSASCC